MDLLYEAALAWQELTACTYRITCGKSGVLHTITLKFDAGEFYHLAGFQYLRDLVLPVQFSHAKAIGAVLDGRITEAHIAKGEHYDAIRERLTAITRLKAALDTSFEVYRFRPDVLPFYTKIKAKNLILAKCGEVAYDFSERRDEEYLRQVCPYLTYAFFSGSDMTEDEVTSLQAFCHSLGVKIVGITRGGEGAVFSENGTVYRQGITPTEVVDTMGAGDSFIAGFLTHYGNYHDMAAALAFASERAAFTCTQHGGFGYPHPFVEEWPGYDGN